ncbi:MAG: tRNA (adenosine(37)-N6)-threonylcarbamoyltransferase complex ATPase subunit type 1 TsaE [Clostridia bacterium]|nr:tRNA (adenosine(37)-N6)-threonylcarbamoyltransferase complex ATPase subunit type 1 TsaE [Clostridia bacterium]
MISVNLTGTVVHGHGKGRTAGFPTANLACEQGTVLPPCGVYAARVTIEGRQYVGVTNVGTRPTADDSALTTVETWILDCSGDLYGKEMKLGLLSYLRGIRKFDSMENLKAQINLDAQKAKTLLAEAPMSAAVITCSASETRDTAAVLAGLLQGGDVLVLRGDLGAGKSEFARGIARGIGVTDAVPSPTFTIMNMYESGMFPLYHFDWYRVEDAEELYEIGAQEQLPGEGITLIEWAERAEELLPETRLEIIIETLNEEMRLLRFSPKGAFRVMDWERILKC